MILEYGDILIFKGNSLISKAIEFITRSKYSHVAIYTEGFHCVEALSKGIEYTHLRDKLDEAYDVYRYKDGLTNIQKDEISRYILKTIATPYNYGEIFSALFEEKLGIKIPYSGKKLICSQYARDVYNYIGIELLPNDTSIITPADISNSKLLVKIN